MKFSNKTYDILKYITQIVLPGLGTLYFGLAGLWGWPYVEEIVGTITVIDTFLGVLLGISTAKYKKANTTDGTMVVDTSDPEKDIYRMELNSDVDSLKDKKQVTFKVENKPATPKKTTKKKTTTTK